MNRAKLKAAADRASANAAKLQRQAEKTLERLLRVCVRYKRLRQRSRSALRRAETAHALYRDSWRRTSTAPADAEQPN